MKSHGSYEWLTGRPELSAMIVRFNTHLASSVHPQRIADRVSAPVLEKLAGSPRGQRRLSGMLCQWWNLNPDGYYDFQPTWRRFALLSFPVLNRLMVFLGAAASCTGLSRIIRRDELNAIRTELGADVFDFAVRQSRLMPFGDDLEQRPLPRNAEIAAQVGWEQFQLCLRGESEELTRRLELKLPPALSLNTAGAEDPVARSRIVSVMQKILVKELKPELGPCFT